MDASAPHGADWQHQLDQAGYVILPQFIDPHWLQALRQATEQRFALEGERAGSEFRLEPGSRRLANLVDKGDVFRRAVVQPRLLELIGHVLGAEFKLSSLNVRSADPHNGTAQPLHSDMGALPDERGYWVCNSVWMLDDFTLDNGPLRVIPGSHRWGRLPQDVLADPAADHPDQQLVTGRAGTVVVMNAHLWHGGMANRSDAARTALHAFYVRRDKPQQQYQKRLVSPQVQAAASPRLRQLLALDDPLNDSLSAADPQRSGFLPPAEHPA